MLEKLCNLASDDLLNVVCRSCLSLISLRAVVEGDQHLVSTSPTPPPPYIPHFLGENYRKKDDDYHFSVKNTELIPRWGLGPQQSSTPRALLTFVRSQFQILSYGPVYGCLNV